MNCGVVVVEEDQEEDEGEQGKMKNNYKNA